MKTDVFSTGDAVVADFRGRKIDGVLAEIRYVRGGGCKYVVAPTDPVVKAKWISITFRDTRFLTKRKGVNGSVLKKAAEEMRERKAAKQERKFKQTEARREVLEEKGLVSIGRQSEFGVGDLVTVKGPGYNWDAVIGKINYKSGTVGIVREGRASERAMEMSALDRMLGLGRRRRAPRQFRFIPATAIIKVTCAEQKMPITLKPADKAEITAKGFKQFRFGREFIESSYVVGSTPANARKGTDYEVSSKQVFEDPDTGLFWRATGSFD